MFKDKLKGKQITEFVGLCAKTDSYKVDDGKETKKAKCIVKSFRNKELAFDHYLNTLMTDEQKIITQNIIRSHKQTNYSESVKKVALDPHDSKRLILDDKVSTLPFGHWRVTKSGYHITPEMVPSYAMSGSLSELALNSVSGSWGIYSKPTTTHKIKEMSANNSTFTKFKKPIEFHQDVAEILGLKNKYNKYQLV